MQCFRYITAQSSNYVAVANYLAVRLDILGENIDFADPEGCLGGNYLFTLRSNPRKAVSYHQHNKLVKKTLEASAVKIDKVTHGSRGASSNIAQDRNVPPEQIDFQGGWASLSTRVTSYTPGAVPGDVMLN
jgi:hypothetical protein